jgi:hypothetical protein
MDVINHAISTAFTSAGCPPAKLSDTARTGYYDPAVRILDDPELDLPVIAIGQVAFYQLREQFCFNETEHVNYTALPYKLNADV